MTTCTAFPTSTAVSDRKILRCYPPVDMSRPFSMLRPEEITIYFHAANTVGKKTCRANCKHCYFFNADPFEVPREEALAIVRSLAAQGYDVSYILADSFAEGALAADAGGSAFRVKDLGLSAWSAGRLLAMDGWKGRLDRGWCLGYRSIIMTAHDAAGTPIVFKGVTPGTVVTQAVRNIQQWNAQHPPGYQTVLTFTFHRSNLTKQNLRQMAQFCLDHGVDTCRFNALANFRREAEFVPHELRREDICRFYGYLAELCEEYAHTPLHFGLSEDIGDAGIEQVLPWLSPEWHQSNRKQWCRAGYRLFALIKVGEELRLVGCVDRWDPPLGRVVRTGSGYSIEWNLSKIEELRRVVVEQNVYACWGGVGCDGDERGFDVDRSVQEQILTK